VLFAFAAIFVLLALSDFGWYELRLPSGLHARVAAASGRLSGGRLGGVAVMGMLSAAIVSPCVAAPLAGALLYIGQTRDTVLGGSALFAMAIGMGVPLLIVGVSEGALLPKSGQWMRTVRRFFGTLLLAVAIWIVSPVIPVAAQMLLWGALLIGTAMFLRAIDPLPHDASGTVRLWKAVGILALLAGTAQVIGAFSGARDPLTPLGNILGSEQPASGPLAFERVRTVAQLDERVFSDPRVRAQLEGVLLLQADVTGNTEEDRALLKRFRLFGPPGIVFFDRGGRVIEGVRVIGYQPPDRFLKSVEAAASRS
jgi:thiol:disulfide interchange protein DsbD